MPGSGSGYRFYSFGIVAVTKPEKVDIIEVLPVEELFMESGAITSSSRKAESNLPSARGVASSSKVSGGATITAKWTPLGASNRETAPDVVANEHVMIFTYADTSDYYWTTAFREPSLRRLERVRYVFSNQPEGIVEYGPDTSYWVEISTKDQNVRLHTSINNGEAAGYDIVLNTKDGIFKIVDTLDNSIELNSVDGVLDGKIREEILLATKRYKLIATESSTVETDQSLIKATLHTEDSKSVVTNGLGVMNGMGVEGTGDFSDGKTFSVKGSMDVDGNVHATGTITDDGGNTNHHSHD